MERRVDDDRSDTEVGRAWLALRGREHRRIVAALAALLRHRFATPINVVVGRASMIASGALTREAVIENARSVQAQAHGILALLDRLADPSSDDASQTSGDAADAIRESVRLLRHLFAPSEATLALDLPEAVGTCEAGGSLVLACVALGEVALATSRPGTRTLVHATHAERDGESARPKRMLVVTVDWRSDRSEEITAAAAPDVILDRPDRAATSFPLTLARGLARHHGGGLEVAPRTEHGVRCVLHWPLIAVAANSR